METVILYLSNIFTFNKFKFWLSILFSWFSYLIGGFDSMIQALYILLVLDFLTWFMLAWRDNKLSKRKMQLGIVKLVTYSMAVIVFNYMHEVTNWANILGIGIREIGVAYLAITDGISCLKHLSDLGVPLPVNLIGKLEDFKKNIDNK